MHSAAGVMLAGGRGAEKRILFLKHSFIPRQRHRILSEISNVVRPRHYPLKRLLCSYSKGQIGRMWGVPSKVHWLQNEARWSVSKRLIEIGGAPSKLAAIKSQTFDQTVVETDCRRVLALFLSLCGSWSRFLTNSDAHTDFFMASVSVGKG